MPRVEVVKPFNQHHHGGLVHEGEVIEVTETRAGELKRLGLARDPAPVLKAAPVLDNKAAPIVENKADIAPRRGPGRPPKVR